jgi:hypothetical protein
MVMFLETYFAMVEQHDISHVLRQRRAVELCVKLGNGGEEMLKILQNAYGTEARSRVAVF